MKLLDEVHEIAMRAEVAKARATLSAQTALIVIGALIISFFVGYVYRDSMKTTLINLEEK